MFIIDHSPLFELRKERIYLRLVVCWNPGLGPRRTDCSMFCLSITPMVGDILKKKEKTILNDLEIENVCLSLGLVNCLLCPLTVGASVTMLDSFSAAKVGER